MYGNEWKYEDIISFELMEKLPEVTVRTNGVGLPTLSKGHFKVGVMAAVCYLFKKGHLHIFILN
jgi:hypothetical protein